MIQEALRKKKKKGSEFALGVLRKTVLDHELWDFYFNTHGAFHAPSAHSAHLSPKQHSYAANRS